MRGIRKTIELAGVLLVTLAVAAPALPGMVLCIAPGGHLSVESAHDGRCHETGDEARHEAAFLAVQSDGCCGDCVDVPLNSDGLPPLVKDVRQDRLQIDGPAPLQAALPAHDGLQNLTISRRPSGPPWAVSPTLRAHRTVVLRT